MPDRDQWDLRGPVLRAEIRSTTPHGERQSVIEFRADGSVLRQSDRSPNGSESSVRYGYDEQGRLVSMAWGAPSAEMHMRVYEYDDAGRLARVISRDQDGNEREFETYSYDAENRRSKKQLLPGSKTSFHTAPEGKDVFKVYYGAPNAASVTTVYDPDGRTLELLFHDAAEALISRVDFVYDASGNLIEESHTTTQSPFSQLEQLPPEQQDALRAVLKGPLARSVHLYDAVGRRIETVRFLFGSLGHERQTFAYNEHGDTIATTSEEDNRSYGFNEEGQLESKLDPPTRSESRFLYEYDAYGNWISKTTEYRHGDAEEFSVSLTETRVLTYFDPI